MKFKGSGIFLVCLLLGGLSGCSGGDRQNTTTPTVTVSSSGRTETLAARLDVPARYQAKYTSKTGISIITVDADVVMPDSSSVDVVEAIPRAFTDKEVQAFIARHNENLIWIDQATKGKYDGHGILKNLANTAPDSGFDMFSLWIFKDEFNAGRDYHSISFDYGINKKTGKLAWKPMLEYMKSRYNITNPNRLPLTAGKALGCTITLKQAQAYADAEAHALCADYEMTSSGQLPIDPIEGNPQYFIFRYTRHLNGIPVSDDSGGEDCSNDYDYTSGLGVITIVVRDDGVCYLKYDNPYDVGKVIQSDCNLLPFNQIMDIFAKVGLLSIQHLERNADLKENTMYVYQIRFGYMAVRQPDNVNAYYYIPVWDFYAERTLYGTGGYAQGKDVGTQLPLGTSVLTINAITGTVIDRNLGY